MIEAAKVYIEEVTNCRALEYCSEGYKMIKFVANQDYDILLPVVTKKLGVPYSSLGVDVTWFVPEGKLSLSKSQSDSYVTLYDGPQLVTNTKLLSRAKRDDGYEIFEVLQAVQKYHKVDFWDYFDSSNNYKRWMSHKAYKADLPQYFAVYQQETKGGQWLNKPYCSFVDVVIEDLDYTGMRYYNQKATIYGRAILEKFYDKDMKEFGSPNWRVSLAALLAQEIGEEIEIIWEGS